MRPGGFQEDRKGGLLLPADTQILAASFCLRPGAFYKGFRGFFVLAWVETNAQWILKRENHFFGLWASEVVEGFHVGQFPRTRSCPCSLQCPSLQSAERTPVLPSLCATGVLSQNRCIFGGLLVCRFVKAWSTSP